MSDFRIVVDSMYQEPLEDIARELGHRWGARGNVKAMVEAIAQRKHTVGDATGLSLEQQQALGRAIVAACDRGEWQDALALNDVLLALPNKQLLDQVTAKIELLQRPWVALLFDSIEQQRPFKLSYQDAAGRLIEFSVCFASLVAHERRTYLDCWCIEIEGNQDIEPLQHNWCLRLDRITDAGIIPIQENWRSQLDSVEIEMIFSGGLAHAYEARPEDTLVEWVEGDRKRVRRFITNSFWFTREILRYGKDCQVIGPPELVERVSGQFAEAAKLYGF